MIKNFARGLIAGAIIGTAMGMLIPNKTNFRRRKMYKNNKNIIRKAGNLIEEIVDLW